MTKYTKTYKVTLELNLESNEKEKFLQENFKSITEINEREVDVLWDVSCDEGIGDIENSMFYILNKGEYGQIVDIEQITKEEEVYQGDE